MKLMNSSQFIRRSQTITLAYKNTPAKQGYFYKCAELGLVQIICFINNSKMAHNYYSFDG